MELTIQQIGWGFTAVEDPLASGLVTAVAGALVLGTFVRWWTGRPLPFKELMAADRKADRKIVARLAFGILILNTAYPYGIQTVGLGAIVTMSAMGPLCLNGSNLWKIWRHRREMPNRVLLVAALNVVLRLIAFAGVMVINKPWAGLEHVTDETVYGLVCGALGAWSFWNYLRCIYDVPKEEKLRILAVADLVAVPFTALAVWGMSFLIGGGYSELSWKVLGLGSVAGVLSFALPTVMGAWVSNKISSSMSGLLYLFDSSIGCLVALAGAALGWLAAVQTPDVWVWRGMAIVLVAAFIAWIWPIPTLKQSGGRLIVEDGHQPA
ncbi:hypothetical protein ACIBI3_24085 [Actinomadura luteofluorescens]|uniref:hypothetical protein n=1 Tax=Actinomadura luteofluorescens TaxID=46163 RepID=UPI003469D0CA